MSEPSEPTPTSALPTATAPRRGSCLGRFISALLVIVITTLIAVAAGAAGLIALGFTPDMPAQLADARARLATAEAQNTDVRAQSGPMQTQLADVARRSDANREALGELQQQKAQLDSLRPDLEEAARQNATVVAEARNSRDAVALFATAEAGRIVLLDELKRRSDRIERFLQRLSDISDDAALDLGTGASPTAFDQPTVQLAPTDTPTPVEPIDTPTQIPTAEVTDTPTAAPTETRRPAATPRASSTATPAASSETPSADGETPTPRP
jgi:hypothetical protein